MELGAVGKVLVTIGVLLAIAGLVLIAVSRIPGLGEGWRLPGDLVFRRGPVTVYIPIATSILLSLLLTGLLYVLSQLGRR